MCWIAFCGFVSTYKSRIESTQWYWSPGLAAGWIRASRKAEQYLKRCEKHLGNRTTQGKPQYYKDFGESVGCRDSMWQKYNSIFGETMTNKLRDKAQCKTEVIKVLNSVALDPIKDTMFLKYYCEKNTSRIEMRWDCSHLNIQLKTNNYGISYSMSSRSSHIVKTSSSLQLVHA